VEDWEHGGFGLYLHWPFCESKCPYCDFNSHVAEQIDQARWQRGYLAEIDRIGAETRGRRLDTLYFGGGTPSLLQPELVAAILDRARATWTVANDWEVTLEANPGSVEAGRFRAYRQAGVSRLSLGVQALSDRDLQRLGRRHSAAEALRALETARDCFERVSFDLIYARQDQSLRDWAQELDLALAQAPDHLSLYQLTVEEGTAFAARLAAGGLRGLPDENRAATLYALTQARCAAAGMPAYEVSNHARPGAEARHNLIYWRGGDYAGIGPGAHGRLTLSGRRYATEAPRAPADWLAQVEQGRPGEAPRTAISAADQGSEYLMMGLRLSDGIDVGRWRTMGGKALPDAVIRELEAEGMVEQRGGRLRVTARGRLLLNGVIRRLLQG
jgi:oxygen-independent coproporphyrinogen-3 oxidase